MKTRRERLARAGVDVLSALIGISLGLATCSLRADSAPNAPRIVLAGPKTILGIFNPTSPASATALHAKAVRLMVAAQDLVNGMDYAPILAGYKKESLTVIVTMTKWNESLVSATVTGGAGGEGVAGKGGRIGFTPAAKGRLPDPSSEAGKALLSFFETFLRKSGPYVDYCTLDNEPMFDVDPMDFVAAAGRPEAPVVVWYQALAARAKSVIKSDPGLAHLRISAPALNDIQRDAEGKRTKTDLINTLLPWETRDTNIDVVDVHLHISTVEDVAASVAFMIRNTRKPLIVTEWSQAGAARKWLMLPVKKSFVTKWGLTPIQAKTNRAFVEACYKTPVSTTEWNEFVGEAPYDKTFMAGAYAAMVQAGVAVATYGAEIQYGNAMFDTKQLFANKTVAHAPGHPEENAQFADWFRAVAQGQ